MKLDITTCLRFVAGFFGWDAFVSAVGELLAERGTVRLHDEQYSYDSDSDTIADVDVFDPHWEVSDQSLRWVSAPNVYRYTISHELFNNVCFAIWALSTHTSSSGMAFTASDVFAIGETGQLSSVYTVLRYLAMTGQVSNPVRGHYRLDRDVPSVRYLMLPNNCHYGSSVVVVD